MNAKAKEAATWTRIEALVPWAENPRRRSDEDIAELAREIRELGFGAPIVARRENNEIVAGHGRRLALQKLLADDPAFRIEGSPGPGFVPVRLLDVDEATAHRLARADNRMGERSGWDYERLLAQLAAEREAGWDRTIEGLSLIHISEPTRLLSISY